MTYSPCPTPAPTPAHTPTPIFFSAYHSPPLPQQNLGEQRFGDFDGRDAPLATTGFLDAPSPCDSNLGVEPANEGAARIAPVVPRV